jgi:uncharacterized protein (DUF433 family)
MKSTDTLSMTIHSDPEIMGGMPVFRGTRVPAQTLFDYLADGCTIQTFLENFPSVQQQQVIALLTHSAASLPRSPRTVYERWGKLGELDRSFDVQHWQSQDVSARMAAVWDLAVSAYALKGQDIHALRLARHLESFQPLSG